MFRICNFMIIDITQKWLCIWLYVYINIYVCILIFLLYINSTIAFLLGREYACTPLILCIYYLYLSIIFIYIFLWNILTIIYSILPLFVSFSCLCVYRFVFNRNAYSVMQSDRNSFCIDVVFKNGIQGGKYILLWRS